MKENEILQVTQEALRNDQPLTFLDHQASNLALLGFVLEGVSAFTQTLTYPDAKTIIPTFLAALGFLYTEYITENSKDLSKAIDDALAEKADYAAFVDEYLPHTIMRRLIGTFDTDKTLGMKGTTSQAFHKFLAAEVLDVSATYQEQQPIIPPTEIPDIVSVALQTYGMPMYNRQKAQELREEAEEAKHLLEVQQIDEGNWSLTELELAAKELGSLFGGSIDFELIYAFSIYQNYMQGKSRRSQQTKPADASASIFQPLYDDYVAPQLQYAATKIRTALFKIKTRHDNLT